jgi:hypothetical protein
MEEAGGKKGRGGGQGEGGRAGIDGRLGNQPKNLGINENAINIPGSCD